VVVYVDFILHIFTMRICFIIINYRMIILSGSRKA